MMNLGGTVRLNKFGLLLVVLLILLVSYYLTSKQRLYERRTVNLRQLLVASIEAAERGGREIVKAKAEGNILEKSKGKTDEGKNVPVTNADLKSNCVMYNGLSRLYPDLKIISEEKERDMCGESVPLELSVALHDEALTDVEVDSSLVDVWIDPLDATQEFTENLTEYVTTMVCVAVSGRPVIGVIHRPFGGTPNTMWAWLNHAHSNINHHPSKESESFIISRSHSGEAVQNLKNSFGDKVEIISAGGSGYKILEVLSKNVTAYVHFTKIHKWDICAGDALVTALDGRMATLTNKEISYSRDSDHTLSEGFMATSDQEVFSVLAQRITRLDS